jgi:hypothetical protein
MTMNGTASLSYTDGVVEGANERGLKVDGSWRNYSKFAKGIAPASAGQHVRLGLDAQGFIRELQVLGGNTEASAPDRGSNTTSIRLRVLEIAASTTVGFAGCNEPGKVTSGSILPLADKLLAWVLEQPARHTIEDLEP